MFTKKLLIPVFMLAMFFAANISYSQDTPKQNDANVVIVPPTGTGVNSGVEDNSHAIGFVIDLNTVMPVDDGTSSKNSEKEKNNRAKNKYNTETNTNTNTSTDTNDNR